MTRLAVFASGRGSNFRAILDHIRLGVLRNVEAALLVTNDSNAPAVAIADERSIPHVFIEGVVGKKFANGEERERARERFDEAAGEILAGHRIDLVANAGFMQVLGAKLVEPYEHRWMNIHPATDLVRFGGKGMYGERVHAAVIQAGERESGCTIHYVDKTIDRGPVVLQTFVPVEPGDNAETLAHRILIQEHRTYSKAIQLHADGRVKVSEGKAAIDWGGGWLDEWNRRQAAFVAYQNEQLKNQNRIVEHAA